MSDKIKRHTSVFTFSSEYFDDSPFDHRRTSRTTHSPVQGQQFSLLMDSQPQEVSIRNLLVTVIRATKGLAASTKPISSRQNRCEGRAPLAFSRLMASFALTAFCETIRTKPAGASPGRLPSLPLRAVETSFEPCCGFRASTTPVQRARSRQEEQRSFLFGVQFGDQWSDTALPSATDLRAVHCFTIGTMSSSIEIVVRMLK